jgi:hypothetical protein
MVVLEELKLYPVMQAEQTFEVEQAEHRGLVQLIHVPFKAE